MHPTLYHSTTNVSYLLFLLLTSTNSRVGIIFTYLVPIAKPTVHLLLHSASASQTHRAEPSRVTITQPSQPALKQLSRRHWQQLCMYSTGGGSRESGAASRGRSERSESSVGPDGAAEVVRRKLVRRRRW